MSVRRTFSKIADSRKAVYSILAVLVSAILVVVFKLSATEAMLIVSPLIALTAAQAHVDAKAPT